MSPDLARAYDKVLVGDDGCWMWQASKDPRGYGWFGFKGKVIHAHRFMYQEFFGPVPEGLELDHLCRRPSCCSPAHLEAVTHRENLRRGKVAEVNRARQLALTHCKRGHPFDEANTHRTGKQRVCRQCRNMRARKYTAERKQEGAA